MARRPTIAVTLGDPGGIGPEIAAKALADPGRRARARYRLYGPGAALVAAASRAGITQFWGIVDPRSPLDRDALASDVVVFDYGAPRARFPAEPTRAGGEVSFRCVEDAIGAARLPVGDVLRADAVVTGPISKEAWALAGRRRFPGHTELFAERFRARRTAMMFVSPRLRVILATGHVRLRRVAGLLTRRRLADVISLGDEACRRLGVERPRIGVCGVNPHAGEGGLLGRDEVREIAPAIRAARRRGYDVSGPYPGDTIYNSALRGRFDLVVAMYHDQGLIPVKLLDRDRAVNVTVGLPVVRTSPDHGTAFDIAGANLADPGSMAAAIDLAVSMAGPGR